MIQEFKELIKNTYDTTIKLQVELQSYKNQSNTENISYAENYFYSVLNQSISNCEYALSKINYEFYELKSVLTEYLNSLNNIKDEYMRSIRRRFRDNENGQEYSAEIKTINENLDNKRKGNYFAINDMAFHSQLLDISEKLITVEEYYQEGKFDDKKAKRHILKLKNALNKINKTKISESNSKMFENMEVLISAYSEKYSAEISKEESEECAKLNYPISKSLTSDIKESNNLTSLYIKQLTNSSDMSTTNSNDNEYVFFSKRMKELQLYFQDFGKYDLFYIRDKIRELQQEAQIFFNKQEYANLEQSNKSPKYVLNIGKECVKQEKKLTESIYSQFNNFLISIEYYLERIKNFRNHSDAFDLHLTLLKEQTAHLDEMSLLTEIFTNVKAPEFLNLKKKAEKIIESASDQINSNTEDALF